MTDISAYVVNASYSPVFEDAEVAAAVVQIAASYDTQASGVHDLVVQIATRCDHGPNGEKLPIIEGGTAEEADVIYHDVIFPECIAYGSTGSPRYVTDKIEVASGAEARNSRWEYPKHEFNIRLDKIPADEISQIMNIWHICSGDFAGFMFMDPMDHTSLNNVSVLAGSEPTATDQIVATATGNRETYPIYKLYTFEGHEKRRRILYPKAGSLLVAVDGEVVPDWLYSYGTTELQFTVPLAPTTFTGSMGTDGVITGADFSSLSVGSLVYISGWSDGSMNRTMGGNPARVLAAGPGSLTVQDYNGGILQPGVALSAEAGITIQSALPPTGALITCGYYFYVPVRFGDGDNMESEIVSGMRESAFADFDQIQLREITE